MTTQKKTTKKTTSKPKAKKPATKRKPKGTTDSKPEAVTSAPSVELPKPSASIAFPPVNHQKKKSLWRRIFGFGR